MGAEVSRRLGNFMLPIVRVAQAVFEVVSSKKGKLTSNGTPSADDERVGCGLDLSVGEVNDLFP